MQAETPLPANRYLHGEWKKSSHSQTSGCVEARIDGPATVSIRDSKNAGGPTITFTHDAWRHFLIIMRHESPRLAILDDR
jgi:hypothetical protein